MGFWFLVLATGLQVLMPSAFFPEVVGATPFYLWAITACTLFSIPKLLPQWTLGSLARNPISACVAGVLLSVVLTGLSRFNFYDTRTAFSEFGKVILYFFLFVGNVDSPRRLDRFLTWLLGMIVVLAACAMLTYFGYIDIPTMRPLERKDEHGVSAIGVVYQMQGNGMFGDPNDFCLCLVMGMLIGLYRFLDKSAGSTRYLFLLPMIGLAYGVSLTQSRGGFLGLVMAMLVLFRAHFGGKKAAFISAVALPAVVILFGGRSTKIDTNGTGRSELWSYAFTELKQSPIFGRGYKISPDLLTLVTHNTYLEVMLEEGLFGATCFIGIFAVAFYELGRRAPPRVAIIDPGLRRLRPIVAAMLAGYAGGIFSISRTYVIPTYILFGIVAAFLRDAATYPPLPPSRLDGRMMKRILVTTFVVLALHYIFTRTVVKFGG